jgi:hypothetical protein
LPTGQAGQAANPGNAAFWLVRAWVRVPDGRLFRELSGGQRRARLPGMHAAARRPHGEACRGVANIRHESEA